MQYSLPADLAIKVAILHASGIIRGKPKQMFAELMSMHQGKLRSTTAVTPLAGGRAPNRGSRRGRLRREEKVPTDADGRAEADGGGEDKKARRRAEPRTFIVPTWMNEENSQRGRSYYLRR